MPVALDEGVFQIDPLAKYAVAFPKMSRAIFTRASSVRSQPADFHLLGAHGLAVGS